MSDEQNSGNRRRVRLTLIFLPATLAALLMIDEIRDLTAALRGRLTASVDVVRGHYAVMGYGYPPSYTHEYSHILRERYGIEYEQAALCIVSKSLMAYVNSYDSISAAAAIRRFGRDIFKETTEEAKANWNRQHPDMPW